MKKRRLSLIAVLLCAFLLSGCIGQVSAPEIETTGTREAGETMTFFCLSSGSSDPVMRLLENEVKEFNRTNSYGVELIMESYEQEQYKTKLAALMAANSQPDIFYTFEAGYLKNFVENEKVYPIGQMIDSDPEWKSRYDDKTIFSSFIYGGEIYAVPNTRQSLVIVCNGQIFKREGISVPETYEDFLSACRSLKEKGYTPLVLPGYEQGMIGNLLQQLADGIAGSTLFYEICNGLAVWENDVYIKAGDQLRQMADNGYFQEHFEDMTEKEGYDLFNQGKAGMLLAQTSSLAKLNPGDTPFYADLDFFLLQASEEKGKGVVVGSTGQAYAVSSNAKNIEAACAFVKQLSETRFQQGLKKTGQELVSNTWKKSEGENGLSPDLKETFKDVKVYTIPFDRVFSDGTGELFNRTAAEIAGGRDPREQLRGLDQWEQGQKKQKNKKRGERI